jgi:ABC-type cobalamin/Fe3+-siderophores transport system ATPase subunit
MAEKILSLKNLSAGFNGKPLWDSISISILKGEIIAIAGPNGAGKTTLLKILAGLARQNSGTFTFHKKEISSWSLRELAKKRSYMEQSITSNPSWSVKEVTALGLFPHKQHGSMFLSQKEKTQVSYALTMVEMDQMSERVFSSLSGGEKRRVLFARAMVQSNQMMFLDEPTAFFDPGQSRRFMDILINLNKKHNSTILAVTHDTDLILNYFNKVILLGPNGFLSFGHPVAVMENHGEEAYGITFQLVKTEKFGYHVLMGKGNNK